MGNNISENLFQSIDGIISARINEVSFDRTILCTIVQLPKSNEISSKYWVSNDIIKFQATALDDTVYKLNDQVYVNIPKGDYSLEKIIIGKYSVNDSSNYLYTNPFKEFEIEKVFKLSQELEVSVNNSNGTAETSNIFWIPSAELEGIKTDYTCFGLKACFDTQTLNGPFGNFGIEINLYGTNKVLWTGILDSSQLIGNPYNLTPAFSNYHLMALPKNFNFQNVKQIEVQFYQKGNFKEDTEGKKIYLKNTTELYLGRLKSEIKNTVANLKSMGLNGIILGPENNYYLYKNGILIDYTTKTEVFDSWKQEGYEILK